MASATVHMLHNPDAVLNRGIFVCGVLDLTQNNILAALEAETGESFTVEHVDLDPIREEAYKALEREDWRPANWGLAIVANFDERTSMANFWDRVENELVGVRPVTVREAVRAVLDGMDGKERSG